MNKSVAKTPLTTGKSVVDAHRTQNAGPSRPFSPSQLEEHFARLSGELGQVLDRFAPRPVDDRSARTVEWTASSQAAKIQRVKAMIAARALRSGFFHGDLFADPAWSILLELYLTELEQRRMTISSLCVGAEVPATTALRWITAMVDRELLVRRPDKLDRRRVYIELSPESSRAMSEYLAASDPA